MSDSDSSGSDEGGDSVREEISESDSLNTLYMMQVGWSSCKKEKPKGKDEQQSNKEEPGIRIDVLEEAGVYPLPSPNKKNTRKRRRSRPILLWEVLQEEIERWIGANEAKDFDLDFKDEQVSEIAEPPPELLMPLLRYQKEWLAWALKQEESVNRGGILADEMGMGKTIQAIALVLAKRAITQTGCGSSRHSWSSNSSEGLLEIKCTLVICPVSAVSQWKNEIDRFTQEGSTRVLVYYGANRRKSLNQFSEYDIVLTTYSTVEVDYRKNVMLPKEKCVWCGKFNCSKNLVTHLLDFCGHMQGSKEGNHGLESSNPKTKSSVHEYETSNFEDGKVKGTGKKSNKREKELVISSSKGSPAGDDQGSPLHSVKWDRIILDEAHLIKARHSNTAKAVLALQSSYKWGLSGTPLQNHVGELYSLVRFLQITPYSYYFCRDCDCTLLDYTKTECLNCVHAPSRHFCWWNKYVGGPIQYSGNADKKKRASILLKHKVLKNIVLRRTKKGRVADLALPPRIVTLRRDTLDINEEDYYETLYKKSQLQFNTYVDTGTLMNHYANVFGLLAQLRKAVNHPYLVIYSNTASIKIRSIDNNDEQECGICNGQTKDLVVTSCKHVFCEACLIDYVAEMGQDSCPSCSKPLTADFTTKMNSGDQGTTENIKGFRCSSIINKISNDDFKTSTKIDALREEIRFMIERDGSAKGLVFSQFLNFLDLIHYSLQKSGIHCVQLVGSMTMAARDVAVRTFTDDPDCKVFLMSLKAGGVALNLTVASHVFLMDPWWNPAVERQAQDRVHRMGQYKPIRIVRFIIENTIEERILKLQERKDKMFEATVGGASDAVVLKLTEADFRYLFAARA